MSYTTEALESGPIPTARAGMSELDMPTKEFVGYDPKGTTTVTGTQREIPKQLVTNEETPAVTEEAVSLSPKISALARKEQAQRQREAQLKRREQELSSKLADAEKYAQLKAKMANKDFGAAEELGISYEEYTTYKLNQQTSENPEEQRYRKVEKELADLKRGQEEQVIKEYQANQSLWKQEIARVVTENEEFVGIREMKAENAVLQHINDSFDEDGVELSAEQAAREIEAAIKKQEERFTQISGLRNKNASEGKVLGPPKNAPKTITQNMTVTSSKPSHKPLHMMSESEQWAEAKRRYEASKQQR